MNKLDDIKLFVSQNNELNHELFLKLTELINLTKSGGINPLKFQEVFFELDNYGIFLESRIKNQVKRNELVKSYLEVIYEKLTNLSIEIKKTNPDINYSSNLIRSLKQFLKNHDIFNKKIKQIFSNINLFIETIENENSDLSILLDGILLNETISFCDYINEMSEDNLKIMKEYDINLKNNFNNFKILFNDFYEIFYTKN